MYALHKCPSNKCIIKFEWSLYSHEAGMALEKCLIQQTWWLPGTHVWALIWTSEPWFSTRRSSYWALIRAVDCLFCEHRFGKSVPSRPLFESVPFYDLGWSDDVTVNPMLLECSFKSNSGKSGKNPSCHLYSYLWHSFFKVYSMSSM